MTPSRFPEKVNFNWSVADLLRGDFKQSEYRRVILPLVVIWRPDCVLEPIKGKVLKKAATTEGAAEMVEKALAHEAGDQFRGEWIANPELHDQVTASLIAESKFGFANVFDATIKGFYLKGGLRPSARGPDQLAVGSGRGCSKR